MTSSVEFNIDFNKEAKWSLYKEKQVGVNYEYPLGILTIKGYKVAIINCKMKKKLEISLYI